MTRPEGELVLLSTGAMRARRHPIALLGVWAWESALALAIGAPVAAIASAATGGGPGSDAALWEPGARVLLDVLWRERHALAGVIRVAGGAAVVATVGGLVPLLALLTVLAYGLRPPVDADDDALAPPRARGPGFAVCLAEALRLFPAAALQLLACGAAQAVVLGAGAVVAPAIGDGLAGALGEARAEQLEALAFVPFLLAASVAGVALDVARAALVRFQMGGARSIALGLRVLRGAPASTWWSWAWRAAASLAPVVAAAWVADRVAGRGGAALAILAALHQAVVMVRVALRASWLAKALRIVDVRLKRGPRRPGEAAGLSAGASLAVLLVACGGSGSSGAASDAGALDGMGMPTDAGSGEASGGPDGGGDDAAGDGGVGGGDGSREGGGGDAGLPGCPPVPALPAGAGKGATYYVSPSGDDAHDGKSQVSAWQTLGKVTATSFGPGDTVLFEGGATFTGCGTFSGSLVKSTAAAPFTVAAYGKGRFTLQASCTGTRVAAVAISGVNGFVLRDATIVGNGGGAEYGVWIDNPGSTPTDYVRVEGCDVSGFYTADTTDFGGEIFVDGIPGGLDHVLLLGNTLHGAMGKTSPDDNGITGFGNGEDVTNVLYQGNTVYDIGGKAGGPNGTVGNGILAAGVDGGVLQCNVVHDGGGNTSTCGGPAGVWAYGSNAVVIQYNEVYGYGPAGAAPSGACDWDGYDLDANVTGSTVQYNYAHDNYGYGFLAYVSGTWKGNTYRYNVGQGDGVELSIGGYQASTTDLAAYANTFYASQKAQVLVAFGVSGGGALGGVVADNVFFAAGGAALVDDYSWNTATVTGVTFLGNDYEAPGGFSITWGGATYASLAAWASATGEETLGGKTVGFAVDPKLASPGSGKVAGGYVPSALAGYELTKGSPMLGAGLDLEKARGISMGPHDYFGNPVPSSVGTGWNVGAYGGR